ncbi:holo-ACP synthase [Clostridium algidicarnis]|uniref:holo-ACP synthase n=1 Tax=Clostridium algidicarnis TaxID=37659 RepID=UPI001C0D60CC|nr:holo-ACP synthase [Clostridium algidicarnis]MBU3205042.1 holo-ACP synthase [Clostridium algidicarnis]MBU3213195.1 holo-ACP synthase [Clostridium algidicarnis]MBU3223250.1 holo-ACP synthase [Clostridium algidicarnis]MBU3228051.1 holo-ACP synthase [Clostridium algidicarnis]MBU3251779.1 holo-ACP synthase [Clostridium algidicarnis]
MGIKGIGTDIIEIDRIKKADLRNAKFALRVFTKKELEYYNKKNYENMAGGFAAKEAISKAIGTGFRGFNFKDIEVLRDTLGRPYVILSKSAEKILRDKFNLKGKDYAVHISISHNNSMAIAYSIIEGI